MIDALVEYWMLAAYLVACCILLAAVAWEIWDRGSITLRNATIYTIIILTPVVNVIAAVWLTFMVASILLSEINWDRTLWQRH